MKRIAVFWIVVAGGCVDKMGQAGDPGDPGPPGAPGAASTTLVWKDVSGTVLANAYPSYHDHTYTMMVSNADGVLFEFTPLTGTSDPMVVNSSALFQGYLSDNCTGPVRAMLSVPPGVAFKLDGRFVTLPSDVDAQGTINSHESLGSCSSNTNNYETVPRALLDALPAVTPPLIAPGPYHVEKL
jgi:hypothetical protein